MSEQRYSCRSKFLVFKFSKIKQKIYEKKHLINNLHTERLAMRERKGRDDVSSE